MLQIATALALTFHHRIDSCPLSALFSLYLFAAISILRFLIASEAACNQVPGPTCTVTAFTRTYLNYAPEGLKSERLIVLFMLTFRQN